MNKFAAYIQISFKQSFQYKWTFAMTLATQPILLFINMALFRSIYDYNGVDTLKGYSFEQMIWYFTSYMLVLSFVWNNTANQIARKIITGDLSMDLLRPVSLFQNLMARSIASRLIAIMMDFIPGLILYSIIIPPEFLTVQSLLTFAVVVIPAFLLNYLFNYLLGITAILIQNNASLLSVVNLLAAFTGGAFIPLEFFPSSVNRIFDFLPFKYIIYWPIQFLLNKQPDTDWMVGKVLLVQLGWIAGLYVVYRIVWRKLLSKFGDAGG